MHKKGVCPMSRAEYMRAYRARKKAEREAAETRPGAGESP